jgi:hypothetical protein
MIRKHENNREGAIDSMEINDGCGKETAANVTMCPTKIARCAKLA